MMEVTATEQQAETSLAFDPCSHPIYHNYSVVGETNEAWLQLLSLKVFQSGDCRTGLDLIDAVHPSGQPTKSPKVFHDAEDLGNYLTSNPIIGGTRFM